MLIGKQVDLWGYKSVWNKRKQENHEVFLLPFCIFDGEQSVKDTFVFQRARRSQKKFIIENIDVVGKPPLALG